MGYGIGVGCGASLLWLGITEPHVGVIIFGAAIIVLGLVLAAIDPG